MWHILEDLTSLLIKIILNTAECAIHSIQIECAKTLLLPGGANIKRKFTV